MVDEKKQEEKDIIEERTFLGVAGEKYFIKPPSAEDIREADFVYSKTYSKSLLAGIVTAAEMQDYLKRRGTIGPEYDKRLEELTLEISLKITELNSTEDIYEKQRLAREIAGLREDIFQWNQRVNGPMSNTCEQISDDARTEFLTTKMVFKEDGNLLWPSYDDYTKEPDKTLTFKARFEVMLYLQGLEPDFLENTPEQVALREVEQEIVKRVEDTSEGKEEENLDENKNENLPSPESSDKAKNNKKPTKSRKKTSSKK